MELGTIMGRWLAERLAAAPWADLVQVIVPVPLHWSRRFSRGFNQAEGLARELAASDRRVAARRLLRVRPTPHQRMLAAGQRRRNVLGAFRVRGGAAELEGRNVLLVDDVMTSGTTIAECTRVLKKAGAAAVFVAVVATADYDYPGSW
jgi:ComF family protein